MRALVVYESMYGNTHAVAVSIAAGLSTTHDVTLVPVTRATPELVAAADLLVAGGPTHLHRRLPALGGRRGPQAGRRADHGSGR
jgi:flavodoxin